MRKLSTIVFGAALTLALPAFAQTSGSGTGTAPDTTSNTPNMQPTTPGTGSGTGTSTGTSVQEAPPAGSSGTRALRPGQNPDATPREQSPGNAPQLPGMKGQN